MTRALPLLLALWLAGCTAPPPPLLSATPPRILVLTAPAVVTTESGIYTVPKGYWIATPQWGAKYRELVEEWVQRGWRIRQLEVELHNEHYRNTKPS